MKQRVSPTESVVASGQRAHSYTRGEELAASLTHGIGTALAIVGLIVVVGRAARHGGRLQVLSTAVYGLTLVLLYLASTLYHAIERPSAKRVLKLLDHMGVYLLIAGTYTPFTLITLRGRWGWIIFGTIWGLAALGIALEACWVLRPRWVSAVVYVAMGWIMLLALRPLVANLASKGLWLLFSGGAAYTLGTIFYVWTRVRYMHALWHLWVIAGSAFHFFAILDYVVGPAPGGG
ncbi:MAG: hemolysin III family protein [Proteobacteria bacterium]|nr:hemolysin III family protein [Pseudomonadota bacterium]